MLVAEGYVHKSPVQLVPEAAPYVVHIDAISKCFAATGLRVGGESYLEQPKMKALITIRVHGLPIQSKGPQSFCVNQN